MAAANTDGTSNGTTDVTVIPSPGASTSRLIPIGGFNIFNNDTVEAVVTIQKHDTGGPTDRVMDKITMQTGDAWSNPFPMVLDSTTERIEIYLGGAVTTNELDWVSHWRDESQ